MVWILVNRVGIFWYWKGCWGWANENGYILWGWGYFLCFFFKKNFFPRVLGIEPRHTRPLSYIPRPFLRQCLPELPKLTSILQSSWGFSPLTPWDYRNVPQAWSSYGFSHSFLLAYSMCQMVCYRLWTRPVSVCLCVRIDK